MSVTGLNAMVRRWQAAGLISERQAAAILAHEAPREDRGLSLWAEILAYLGAALALVAALTLVGDRWEALPTGARLGLLAVGTVALLVAGRFFAAPAHTAEGRLGSVLWASSAIMGAYLAGYAVYELVPDADFRETVLIGGLAAVPYALVLWRFRPQALQQITLFASALATMVAGVAGLEDEASGIVGWSFLLAGTAWFALTKMELVRPERTGYALGSASVLVGAQTVAIEQTGVGLVAGLVASCALLALGPYMRQIVVLAFGTAGVLLFLTQAVFQYFGAGAAAPLILLLTGVGLVAGAVLPKRSRAVARPD